MNTSPEQTGCPYLHSENSGQLCEAWRAATATQQSADFAYAANWIDGFGAIFAFISVMLLICTLRLTRKQVRVTIEDRDNAREEAAKLSVITASALAQARRSADAATEQSTTAAEAAAKEFRPHVTVRALSLMIQSENGQPFTQILVRNIGRGLALGCVVSARTEVAHFLDPELGDLEIIGGSSVHLMPSEHLDLPVRPSQSFSEKELKEITNGNPVRMWTHGKVDYFDESGGAHTTHFAFAYSGGPLLRSERDEAPRYEMPLSLPPPT